MMLRNVINSKYAFVFHYSFMKLNFFRHILDLFSHGTFLLVGCFCGARGYLKYEYDLRPYIRDFPTKFPPWHDINFIAAVMFNVIDFGGCYVTWDDLSCIKWRFNNVKLSSAKLTWAYNINDNNVSYLPWNTFYLDDLYMDGLSVVVLLRRTCWREMKMRNTS